MIGIDIDLSEISQRIGRLLQGGRQISYLLYDMKNHSVVAHSDPSRTATRLMTSGWPNSRGAAAPC